MKKIKRLKLFINFLKKNNVYEKYILNLTNKSSIFYRELLNLPKTPDIFISNLIEKRPEELINLSFNWSSTKEGAHFWEVLHYSWNNIIQNEE